MTTNLSPFCVYTIVHVDELNRVHKAGGAGSFTENKRWVKASQLLGEARAAGQRLPVLFADAATTEGLIYHALLIEIEILGESIEGPTRYRFEGLTPIRPPISKSALIKMNGGQPLSDDYIRPYVLCHTPHFLRPAPKPEPATVQPFSQPATVAPSQSQARKPATPIYLFGYSGKTLAQIERALGESGLLLDIRYSPHSRKAGFSKSGFERVFGDRYRHVRELGNAGYQSGDLQLADPDVGLKIVEALAAEQDGPLFLMCACEDGEFCHRRYVGELLKKRGYTIREYDFEAGD